MGEWEYGEWEYGEWEYGGMGVWGMGMDHHARVTQICMTINAACT